MKLEQMISDQLGNRGGSATGILLAFARWAHNCLPVAQLRTANSILRFNRRRNLRVSFPLFDYDIQLQAERSAVHVLLYLKREGFVEDAAILAPHLKKGMTVVDVGANIGYLTYFFCRSVGPDGQVFSFEPDLSNFKELADNVRRNAIDFCHPFQVAVGASEGRVAFAPGLNGHIALGSDLGPHCPLVSLDSFLEQRRIERVDLVKIDVEGWELDVLQGMRRVLESNHTPILYVEVHPRGFLGKGDPESVCSLLEAHYQNIVAYRTWSNVRSGLTTWKRLSYALSSAPGAGQPTPITPAEAKQLRNETYQLLCLPSSSSASR